MNRFRYLAVSVALTAACMGMHASTRAATDGLLSSSSTGTSNITLNKGDLVQINNLTDVRFANWTAGMGAQNATGDACVYSTTGGYLVKALSSSNQTGFALSDGGSNFIPYDLDWSDRQRRPETRVSLENGITYPRPLRSAELLNCGDVGGTNVTFTVKLSAADLQAAPVGSYADILTFIVVPE